MLNWLLVHYRFLAKSNAQQRKSQKKVLPLNINLSISHSTVIFLFRSLNRSNYMDVKNIQLSFYKTIIFIVAKILKCIFSYIRDLILLLNHGGSRSSHTNVWCGITITKDKTNPNQNKMKNITCKGILVFSWGIKREYCSEMG